MYLISVYYKVFTSQFRTIDLVRFLCTIVAGRSYHRGGTFVPSWWYVCTIVVVRLYHRGGTTFISWVHVFYRADARL